MKLAVTAAILLAVSGPALADDWAATAQDEIRFAALTIADQGWTLEREIHAEGLADGQKGYTSLRLGDRNEYAIVALCDQHCGDVDLALYDQTDTLIGEDCTESGLPMVHVAPAARAGYELEVRMFNCAEEACRYSVAVFSRPGRTTIGSR